MSRAQDPVFPVPIGQVPDGLTIREYYAGLMLQGMLANHEREASFIGFARDAVRFADTLIEALEENQ